VIVATLPKQKKCLTKPVQKLQNFTLPHFWNPFYAWLRQRTQLQHHTKHIVYSSREPNGWMSFASHPQQSPFDSRESIQQCRCRLWASKPLADHLYPLMLSRKCQERGGLPVVILPNHYKSNDGQRHLIMHRETSNPDPYAPPLVPLCPFASACNPL